MKLYKRYCQENGYLDRLEELKRRREEKKGGGKEKEKNVFPEKLPPHELFYYLYPSDIQLILNCNERTARDYREALKDIYFEYQY
jgi:hypothetical protein